MSTGFPCSSCGKPITSADGNEGRITTCEHCHEHVPIPELSPGGAPVYRHEESDAEPELVCGDPETVSAVSNHIEMNIGKVAGVLHEVVSTLVHIDVHIVPPDKDRRFTTLVTSGMSDRPMAAPEELLEDYGHAELVMCIPGDWPLEEAAMRDETYYWPIRLLKRLARLPHAVETWLGHGHSIPNGDPAEPYAPNTKLCGAVLCATFWFGKEFLWLTTPNGKKITFLSVIPVYDEEMSFKLNSNADDLFDRMERRLGVIPFVVDPRRKNAGKKRFGLF